MNAIDKSTRERPFLFSNSFANFKRQEATNKYIKMLGDQKSVCLEVYNDHKNAINFYMPMQ